jgi:hypothetical protein
MSSLSPSSSPSVDPPSFSFIQPSKAINP